MCEPWSLSLSLSLFNILMILECLECEDRPGWNLVFKRQPRAPLVHVFFSFFHGLYQIPVCHLLSFFISRVAFDCYS
jgi:hypothetical protein